jgi:hypothetical protein
MRVATMRAGTLILLSAGLLLATNPAWAARVILPRGTIVYAQLGEKVTSDHGDFPVGYQPAGYVWRDVVVGGMTIIEAGTPIVLMVTDGDPRGIGARAGTMEISAMYVQAVGGAEITLRGGYGQAAPDSSAWNAVLGIALFGAAWSSNEFNPFIALPAALLPGRQAVLEEGIVFDAQVPSYTYIDVPETTVPTLNLRPPSGLTVTVLIEEVTETSTQLPLAIQYCGEGWTGDIHIDRINEGLVRRIDTTVLNVRARNECFDARVVIELEELKDHFQRGINRFELTMGDVTEEVVLNVEL